MSNRFVQAIKAIRARRAAYEKSRGRRLPLIQASLGHDDQIKILSDGFIKPLRPTRREVQEYLDENCVVSPLY